MSDSLPVSSDVIVVGAGISGLLAGQVLRERGLSVIVLDKGRSVGGRLATRRIGPGVADHGAQFFTVRSQEFQAWVERWQAMGLIFEWSRGWSDGSLHRVVPDGHPRYAVTGGMTTLAKHLAEGLDCRTDVLVGTIQHDGTAWVLTTAEHGEFRGRGLLLSTPVPQALDLLMAGGITLELDDLAMLQGLTYAPNLTGLFWVEGALYVPSPGAVQRAGTAVRWIADNQRKGISPDATILTIQASPEYSTALWDKPDDTVLAELRSSFDLFMSPRSAVREAQLKRWRYSLPLVTFPQQYLKLSEPGALVFAGDAFGGPRVEGAALSGLAAGAALAEAVK